MYLCKTLELYHQLIYIFRWETVLKNKIPCFICEAYGWATHGIRVQPDHRFRIASVTKVLTAASIMRLAEEGRLQLTDRVFGPKGLS